MQDGSRNSQLLTIYQKRIRVTISERNLAYFNLNPKKFLRRFVTMDETWIYHYTPESREGSKQWIKSGESVPKRPKTQQSIVKVMASVFWDAHEVIFVHYLEKGRTFTGAYYAALLEWLMTKSGRNGHIWRRKNPLPYDNAPSHIAQAKKHELGFESLPYPSYSPDLKRWLCGRRFESNEEVEWETEGYFGGFDKSYYLEGIKKLKDRWTRCIELKREYIEK